jgi:hypothetical protein
MHMRLGLVNGEIIESDYFTDAQIMDEISEADGRIGNGYMADVRVESIEDVIAFMEASLLNTRINGGVFTILINGENERYDSDEVAWFRMVRD